MMFMKPTTNAVYITAYAVQESLKEVRSFIYLFYFRVFQRKTSVHNKVAQILLN